MKRMHFLSSAVGLLFLAGQAWADDRPVLAVTEFSNDSGAGWWRGGVGWELADMLTNELAATRAFRVVEREQLRAVLDEQNLAASGRVAGGTGAQIGALVGAQYLVTGQVSAYEENTKSTGGGISFRGLSVGGKSESAYLAIDLRVIDTTTGEIAYTRTVEGTSKGSGISLGVHRGGFGGSLASENNTPAGKAIRAALVEATDYLECVMVTQSRRCMNEYDAKDDRRRDKTRSAIDLDD
ncbi:MAG: CsgG/HfaB family protein [Xanthomonadales bacterium]|nr:CsgG/HfaB family protein [Xanthomonadales bacterium]MCB1633589.1 CsgG/HfaB family protein [Xanthomonadales bacterium]